MTGKNRAPIEALANLTKEQRSLFDALDLVEWRSIGHRLGPFHPWMGAELVHLGLAERRPRAKKAGAFEYRRLAPVAGVRLSERGKR